MQLTYYGHATFVLEAGGTAILIDPFNEQCGYPIPRIAADAVVISHEHFDHNNVQMAAGSPRVVRALTDGGKDWARLAERIGPVHLSTVATYHDETQGSQRGKNAMLIFDTEGVRLVHCGDLGHTLSDDQVQALGKVDVLLIPVGGHYTIGPQEAKTVVGQVRPRVVIPMHYRTEVNPDWPIATIEGFLAGQPRVRQHGRTVTISGAALPAEPEVWVLAHA